MAETPTNGGSDRASKIADFGPDIDLGSGHYLKFIRWAPDDLPANRELYGVPLPCVEKAAASILHPAKTETGWCEGMIHFDIPEAILMRQPSHHLWKVESWDLLTLSPSVLCRCGDHGFIRDGKWVPA